MRRLALTLGSVGIVSLVACTSTVSRPPWAPEPNTSTSAPSVIVGAPGAVEAPTTTSVVPPAAAPVSTGSDPKTMAPMRARPISGGTLRVLSDGRTAVAADSDRDLVYVVDLVTGKVLHTVALAAGDEPGRVVEDDAGLAHVALRSGGAVATINPATGALLARRELCAAPRGLAFEKATGELHVACAGGELVSIAAMPSVTKPLRTLQIERDLRDVVVSTGGRLMVSTFRTASVYTIAGDGTVGTPRSMGVSSRSGNPGVAWRMVERSDGKAMLLHELAQQRPLGVFPGAYGNGTSCGSIVTSTVTVVAPEGDAPPSAPAFSGAVVAADVAVSPAGDQMAVVSIATGGSQIQFFDTTDAGTTMVNNGCWPESSPSLVDANEAATGGLEAPTSYLPPNGEIVAIAYDARGNVVVQSREPASLQILTQRRAAIVLSDETRFDAGHQLFHAATSGQVACVSCHPEGGEDGRVWQFQTLGARRTQSLRGGIMDTAPFHWSGDENNMTSLMKDVFQGRMAGGTVDDARVLALGQWLDQIPTIPLSHAADDGMVSRGAALFTSAGCVACHAGADFTSGLTVDVGTGGSFQVPQLHGLALRAPYMHNGCAQTLRDRFTAGCGGDEKHSVGMLSNAQVGDLVGYLETL